MQERTRHLQHPALVRTATDADVKGLTQGFTMLQSPRAASTTTAAAAALRQRTPREVETSDAKVARYRSEDRNVHARVALRDGPAVMPRLRAAHSSPACENLVSGATPRGGLRAANTPSPPPRGFSAKDTEPGVGERPWTADDVVSKTGAPGHAEHLSPGDQPSSGRLWHPSGKHDASPLACGGMPSQRQRKALIGAHGKALSADALQVVSPWRDRLLPDLGALDEAKVATASHRDASKSAATTTSASLTQPAKVDNWLKKLDKKIEEAVLQVFMVTPQTPRLDTGGGGKPEQLCTRVLDHLYIGSMFALSDNATECMDAHGLTALIDCSTRRRQHPNVVLPEGTSLLTLYLRDKTTQDVSGTFLPAIQFIEETMREGGKVLVFCQRGISRSATIILAYLIWKFNWSYADAVNFLKQKRNKVNPNIGFSMQLMTWATTRPSTVTRQTLLYRVDLSDQERTFRAFPDGVRTSLALASGPAVEVRRSMFAPMTGRENPGNEPPGNAASSSGDNVQQLPRCWLACAPACETQFVWHDVDTPEEVLAAAERAATLFSTFEEAPPRVVRVPCGYENATFWHALALAHGDEVEVSPSLRGRRAITVEQQDVKHTL
ncbi:Dual specificity protein phosphatase, putative [Hondaea fermentalgiana]|uniref:protein-tyrosine-phosphatase n=1 Tax=Hondaea fermentalgiana TaxID=2315210 RepID=A0A2R5GDX4_9STRA|nr:Dual specificity protein phosphatase, putative [Hondaea fermentalgiana]|eukprot:GBG29137.1 Dual specificity protein phosphatase, putative [Hondaea fermentalgiana]